MQAARSRHSSRMSAAGARPAKPGGQGIAAVASAASAPGHTDQLAAPRLADCRPNLVSPSRRCRCWCHFSSIERGGAAVDRPRPAVAARGVPQSAPDRFVRREGQKIVHVHSSPRRPCPRGSLEGIHDRSSPHHSHPLAVPHSAGCGGSAAAASAAFRCRGAAGGVRTLL